MTIAVYMDENVPRQITLGLRLRGVDVLSVQEDEQAGSPDLLVLQRATELQRVLFTRDDDFLAIASTSQQSGKFFAGIIYAFGVKLTNSSHHFPLGSTPLLSSN